MKVKQGIPKTSEAVLVGTRVAPETKARFAEVARVNSRSISGELRVLIETHLRENENPRAVAAAGGLDERG